MPALYWVQGGGCGGDTFSLLSAALPDISALFQAFDIKLP